MNFDELSHKGRISIEEIYNYILGNLDSERKRDLESILQNSKDDFNTYMDLREAIHLLNKDVKIDPKNQQKVIQMVHQTKIKNYIHYKIRSIQDKIFISSSDQEDLGFTGIIADFAVRGSKPGLITISRNIDGDDIRLVLTPIPDKNCYSLEINYETHEKLSCILYVNDEEWELTRDISSNPQFDSLIPENSELKLEFKVKGELKFTIGLTLINE